MDNPWIKFYLCMYSNAYLFLIGDIQDLVETAYFTSKQNKEILCININIL